MGALRFTAAAVIVAGLIVVLVYTFGSGESSQEPSGAASGNLPRRASPSGPPTEVTRIAPPHGARVCPRPEIAVDLRLTDALRKAGVLDLSKVRLALDGRDVTAEARVLGTMDFPQGRASLMYTPRRPLAPGLHRATLTIASVAGPRAFAWTFTVAAIPCP
jgi:hypothetical protein